MEHHPTIRIGATKLYIPHSTIFAPNLVLSINLVKVWRQNLILDENRHIMVRD
jgi:hypothetical protein